MRDDGDDDDVAEDVVGVVFSFSPFPSLLSDDDDEEDDEEEDESSDDDDEADDEEEEDEVRDHDDDDAEVSDDDEVRDDDDDDDYDDDDVSESSAPSLKLSVVGEMPDARMFNDLATLMAMDVCTFNGVLPKVSCPSLTTSLLMRS